MHHACNSIYRMYGTSGNLIIAVRKPGPLCSLQMSKLTIHLTLSFAGAELGPGEVIWLHVVNPFDRDIALPINHQTKVESALGFEPQPTTPKRGLAQYIVRLGSQETGQ